MIDVRLFATLPTKSRDGRRIYQVEPREGLTIRDLVEEQGLDPGDIHIAMVNGLRTGLDTELSDGDRVGLFPPVGGG
ncbi:MAG: MoaD/ThiS family protein [Thermoleophilia bacterium]